MFVIGEVETEGIQWEKFKNTIELKTEQVRLFSIDFDGSIIPINFCI